MHAHTQRVLCCYSLEAFLLEEWHPASIGGFPPLFAASRFDWRQFAAKTCLPLCLAASRLYGCFPLLLAAIRLEELHPASIGGLPLLLAARPLRLVVDVLLQQHAYMLS